MRIEYYDADTHDLVRRDAYSQALVDALRERDEARAELSEVRRIVTETLPDLADQPDRETTVRRVAALATRYQYERDAAALLRKDVDRWEATSQAQAIEEHKLRAEVEWLRKKNAEQANQIHDLVVRDAKPAVPPIVTTATHVQIPRADYERVAHLLDGATPPAVCAVDVEAAAKEIADGFELHLGDDDTRTESLIVAILRKHTRPIDQTSPAVCTVDVKATARSVSRIIEGGDEGNFEGTVEAALYEHTRPVSVESVAQALYESAAPRTVHDWPLASGVTKETYIVQARAALRVIGARLAENTGTGAPVPTQHPENQHGYGIRRHVRSADERQAADGSGNRSEDRIPRADSAGVVGGEGVPTPGIEPGEAARGPQGDGSRPALDCHRADALPGGPDGCGSRGDATGVLLTRVAALESALRLETDLRVHGDAVIGARLNLLIKAAPDVGAGLAEPVEPRPASRLGDPYGDCSKLMRGPHDWIERAGGGVECGRGCGSAMGIPAKVRVKPPKGHTIKTRGTGRDADQIAEQVDAAWIKSLREHGVEVDDE